MGLDIRFKPDLLEAAIAQIGEKAIKGMSDKMRKIAIRMRDLARAYAPRKTGLLEEEIHYAAIPKGKNRRNVYVIWVDLDASRKSGKAGELGDYAYIMEEQLRPYGQLGKPIFLGRKSQLKRDEGKKVGGRFLSRAFIETTAGIEQELAAEVRRVLGGARTADVNYQRAAREESDE